MAELCQDAARLVMKIIGMRIPDDKEGAAGAEEASVGAGLGIGPKAVIAVA